MTQMRELATNDFKTANRNMFNNVKENMDITSEQTGTLSREMQTLLKRTKWKL